MGALMPVHHCRCCGRMQDGIHYDSNRVFVVLCYVYGWRTRSFVSQTWTLLYLNWRWLIDFQYYMHCNDCCKSHCREFVVDILLHLISIEGQKSVFHVSTSNGRKFISHSFLFGIPLGTNPSESISFRPVYDAFHTTQVEHKNPTTMVSSFLPWWNSRTICAPIHTASSNSFGEWMMMEMRMWCLD